MSTKPIEQFVKRPIRAPNAPDERHLQSLFADVSTPDLQMFWFHFTADRAFSRANCTVPHWKTREQELVFRHTLTDYQFYPKEKDSSGKWIVVRADLEDHIARCLLQHINSERTAAEQFRTAPLFHRLHAWLGIAIVFSTFLAIPGAICVVILGILLHRNLWRALTGPAITAFIIGYCTYLVFGLVQPLFWRMYRSRYATPTPNQALQPTAGRSDV